MNITKRKRKVMKKHSLCINTYPSWAGEDRVIATLHKYYPNSHCIVELQGKTEKGAIKAVLAYIKKNKGVL